MRKLTDCILFQEAYDHEEINEKDFMIDSNLNCSSEPIKIQNLDGFIVNELNDSLLTDKKIRAMKFEKEEENETDDVYLETGYLCDREDRICDETTFLISKLQSKLDETKINNFDNMIKLADRVDHIQNMERLKNFEMVEKVR